MTFWVLAIVTIGLSSPVEDNDCVVHLPKCPPMAFAVLDSDSDLPFKEYCLPDREDEREDEVEDDGDGKVLRAHQSHPPLERPGCWSSGYPTASCWAMGLCPAARTNHLRC